MTQIPCPNCGELVECREEAIGRKMRCPGCRVLLQLDADSEGRPGWGRPRRRFGLVKLAFVLGVFVAGLGIGFLWGRGSAHHGPTGLSVNSFGVFSASNTVVVDDQPPPPPPRPAPPRPPSLP